MSGKHNRTAKGRMTTSATAAGAHARVVLDTNYYRGANVALLGELVRRDFAISLSLNAFVEHWTRTNSENKLGFLTGRAKNIAPFIDAQTPLLPTGRQLTALVGGSVRDGVDPQLERFMCWTRETWRYLVAGDVPEDWWRRGAFAGDLTMGDHLRTWSALRQMTPSVFPDALALPKDQALRKLAAEFLHAAAVMETMPGNVQSRKHAFYVVAALHVVRSHNAPASYSPDPNTAEDIDLLQHVATPSVLLTRDFELIEFVDASGTHQRPWVRTIGEVLTDGAPHGVPWGKNARRETARFRRRSRGELAALEDHVLQQITGR
jgi:hypothetical protein